MKKTENKKFLLILVGIFLLYVAIHYWPAISLFLGELLSAASPLFIGAIIAYFINLPMKFYEKHLFSKTKKPFLQKLRRPTCLLLAVISFAVVISLVLGLVVPQLISCIQLIITKTPTAIEDTIAFLQKSDLISDKVLSPLAAIDWDSRVDQLMDLISGGFTDMMSIVINTVTGVISGLITAFFSLIFSLYLLSGKDKLRQQCHRLATAFLPEKAVGTLSYLLKTVDSSFHRYLVGQCTEAVILGVLCAIGMLILRLPYAALIGALVAFTAMIPVAGAYIGAAVGAFMILTVSPLKALIFLVFILVLQQLEGNLIYPKVVGSSMGLPGIWVLAAVTVGGGLAGVLGMLFGVPLAAALYRIVQDALHAKEAALATEQPSPEESPTEK